MKKILVLVLALTTFAWAQHGGHGGGGGGGQGGGGGYHGGQSNSGGNQGHYSAPAPQSREYSGPRDTGRVAPPNGRVAPMPRNEGRAPVIINRNIIGQRNYGPRSEYRGNYGRYSYGGRPYWGYPYRRGGHSYFGWGMAYGSPYWYGYLGFPYWYYPDYGWYVYDGYGYRQTPCKKEKLRSNDGTRHEVLVCRQGDGSWQVVADSNEQHQQFAPPPLPPQNLQQGPPGPMQDIPDQR